MTMSSMAIDATRLPPRSQSKPAVFVVDSDPSARKALETLIRRAGWQPEPFTCAEEFLSCRRCSGPTCLVLDLALPNLSGLELQRRVAADRPEMPIIFITGYTDVPMTVQAMKAGAAEFLTKPFRDDVVVSAIGQAIEWSSAALERRIRITALRDRYETLSPREREVMALVAAGLLNKQVGGELGISEITVKAHRGRVMQKMQARSFVDLVNMAVSLRVANDYLGPISEPAPKPQYRQYLRSIDVPSLSSHFQWRRTGAVNRPADVRIAVTETPLGIG